MKEYNLDKIVNHKIATVAVLLKRQAFRLIADNNLEITPEQWVLLYYLWEKDGLSIGELATKSKKDFGNVTRIVEKLIKSGYVEKLKSKTDSRKSNVYILPKADSIKNKIMKCWVESSEISLKGISENEQKILLDLLQKVENNIIENNNRLEKSSGL